MGFLSFFNNIQFSLFVCCLTSVQWSVRVLLAGLPSLLTSFANQDLRSTVSESLFIDQRELRLTDCQLSRWNLLLEQWRATMNYFVKYIRLLFLLSATSALGPSYGKAVGFSFSSSILNSGLPNDTAVQTDDVTSGSITPDSENVILDPHEIEGGYPDEHEQAPEFGSTDSMLKWAISHSDPAELAESAKKVSAMTPEELEAKRAHIRDLVEAMRMPSAADVMKLAIADVSNASLDAAAVLRALEELLVLVEPIDNANDLHKLGGLTALAAILGHSEGSVRRLGAWVVGKAAQNNPTVQNQILEEGLLPTLVRHLANPGAEEATKSLYAVSAAIRNHVPAQVAFFEGWGSGPKGENEGRGGWHDLVSLLTPTVHLRIRKKAVFLVGDLAEQQGVGGGWGGGGLGPPAELEPHQPPATVLCAVVEMVKGGGDADLDLQEKALLTLTSLLKVGPLVRHRLVEECGILSALELCEQMLGEERGRDGDGDGGYAEEVEGLRREVARTLGEYQKGM